MGRQKKSWSIFLSTALRFGACGLTYSLFQKVDGSVPTWLKSCLWARFIFLSRKKKQSYGEQLSYACCGQSGLMGTKLCLRMSGFHLIG